MGKHVIEIVTVQAGQPRPYADARYEAYLSCRVEGTLLHGSVFYLQLKEEDVKILTRLFVREFPDEPAHAFSPRLERCAPVGPTPEMTQTAHEKWPPGPFTRWHVRVVQPFTD